MKTKLKHRVKSRVVDWNHWTLSAFDDVESSRGKHQPPGGELIQRLNHLASKPPFCWVYKMKDRLTRL
ncbi:MAG: hypothetical protein M3N30_04515 [Bacteroidota bacterium]|nr:hypothetical protein [Bacteroidota bacterium]